MANPRYRQICDFKRVTAERHSNGAVDGELLFTEPDLKAPLGNALNTLRGRPPFTTEEIQRLQGGGKTSKNEATTVCSLFCKRDPCSPPAACPGHPLANCVSKCCVSHWYYPDQYHEVTKTC
ncbi:hypothetical protein BV898_02796 [Hypsibius exemplaris]|uniref:Uncharacterized protein n=1 Tax=Hypsibius exemplaris TaxID=2072580 RepID=A0A1W0X729_HYPEX|nr:hypothetical protein BV898_02796 [Hypsibius exemplaris]